MYRDIEKKQEIQVGDIVTCYGEPSLVIKILDFGTIFVEQISTGRCYCMTGLMWSK